MRRVALGWLIGTAAVQQLSVLPDMLWSLFAMIALLIAVYFVRAYGLFVVSIGLGFFFASLFAHQQLSGELPAELEGQDVLVEGWVASLPERIPVGKRGDRLRFQFEPQNLQWQGEAQAVPGKLLLSWYPRKGQSTPELRVGERWRLTVRLKRPHGFSNPGGFDYEAWLFQQGIRARGYVRTSKDPSASLNQKLAPAGGAYWVDQVRESLREKLLASLDEHPLRGMVLALAIGDRQLIEPEQWKVLTRTGTNHLLAISGLHVGLVAGLAFFLMRRLWRFSSRAVVYWPASKAGALAGLIAAVVYALLAGFSIPTQRALVMVAVVMVATLLQRQTRPSSLLALALLLVLIIDPLAVLAAGFWLSFGAVVVIVYGMSGRLAMRSLWWRWGRVQWLVAVGLIPALLLFFQQASIVSPLANLLAVPWVSLLTVPLTLIASLVLWVMPVVGEWLLGLAALSLDGLWYWLSMLSDWPFAAWPHQAPPLWALPVGLIGIAWLLAPRGVPARWIGVVGLLPLAFVTPNVIPTGEARFTLLDVGQGLAAVVQTQNHVLVFDTGPRFSTGFNTGEAVVAPFLRSQGWHQIDTLLVSHGDNDHIGGVEGLRTAIPVGRVLSSVPQRLAGAEACEAGQRWQWDGVHFAILNPDSAIPVSGGRSDNNRSCVLRVQAGNQRLLFTGDIEQAAEREMVNRLDLAAEVLVVPHHGSLTSSTQEFVTAVSPELALFPVGYRNRYGFPKPAVLQRYVEQQVRMLDTAQHGAITVSLGSTAGLSTVDTHRQRAARYWHSP